MTDDQTTSVTDEPSPGSRLAARGRSVLRRLGDLGRGFLELVFDNVLLATFLSLALILIALFFIGLHKIGPSSSGQETTLSNTLTLVDEGRVTEATLLDQDSRLVYLTKAGKRFWTAYPHSDSYTSTLLSTLQKANVVVVVDS